MSSAQLIGERKSLAAAVIEREQEAEEHALVIKTLKQQEGSKRAWRLVGDVLVERTVEELLPEVQKNKDNLLVIAQNIKKQLESKQKELLAFQEKYNVRIKRPSEGGMWPADGRTQEHSEVASSTDGAKTSGQGVLVTDK